MIQPLAAPPNFRIKESYRVRYAEIDPQGIVNHAHYANYFAGARVAYFRAMGYDPTGTLHDRTQLVVAHLEIDFRAPAHFDDHLDVWCRVSKVGKASVTFEYEVRNGMTQEVQADGNSVLVAISIDGLQPVQIPEELRRRVERLERW